MDYYEKKKFIKDIKNSDSVRDVFAVVKKSAINEYKNGYMFNLTLQDNTGSIDLRFFGSSNKASVESVYASVDKGMVVYIEATANEYNGLLGLIIRPENKLVSLKSGTYNKSSLIRHTKKDIGKLKIRLRELIASITDLEIKSLMEHLFDVHMFEIFSVAPAAVGNHHAFEGGLLEHSVALAEIVLSVHSVHPELNRDYLVCGSLLQDIGKTQEIEGDITYSFSSEGNLVGHVVLGAQMVAKAADELHIAKEKKLKLIHLVLSHHNEMEYGAAVEPRFPEAAVVALADALDAQTQMFLEEFDKESAEESVYSKKLERFIYLK